MSETVAIQARRNWRSLLILAVVAGAVLAGTVGLWAHYGTAVFFEMIAAGIAACF